MIRLVLALSLAAATIIASVASAQPRDTRTWYQAYRDAQAKIRQADWQGALNDLDAAARAGAPRPGRSVNLTGDIYDSYNPDYYRGIALSNLQRFAEADQALERVRQAGLITARDALFAEFDRLSKDVKDNVQKLAAVQTPVQRPPINATQTASNPPTTSPNVGGGAAAGGGGVASNDIRAAAPGGASARLGGSVLGSQVSPTFPNAGGAVGSQPSVTLEQAKAAAAQRVQAAVLGQRTPVQAKADAGVITKSPPPRATVERDAMLAFHLGDYAGVAERLGSIVDFGVATPRMYLYLACSQVALVLTGRAQAPASPAGLAPAATIEQARSLVARVGDTAPLSRDLALISPRIREQLGLRP